MNENNNSVEKIISDDPTVEVDVAENHHHHHSHHSHHHHRSHHSHHRHHHKRSKSKSSSNKKNGKIKSFFKKNRSLIVNIVSCTISLVLLIILAAQSDAFKAETKNDNHTTVTKSSVGVETSVYMNDVSLVNPAIVTYMNKSDHKTAHDVYGLYDGYNNDLNVGLPLTFSYRTTSLPSNVNVSEATLYVSTDSTFKNSLRYDMDINGSSIDIYHLKTGVNYYYRLKLTLSNKKVVSTIGEFTTKNTPRILSIDGIDNVRDIGGWQDINGKKIKQGLLYRGTELEGAVEAKYKLTEEGKNDMLAELGIRFDMDLRSKAENKSGVNALGSNVEHNYYPITAYNGVFDETNKNIIKNIFTDLANESNYPMYIHCTYGSDRTGTVCYLLEALLGASDDDLYKEYELSAFTESYVNDKEFASFLTRVNMLEGDTTQEKVEKYLLSAGVTPEQIASIKTIFLEDK